MIKPDLNGNPACFNKAGGRNKELITEWLKKLAGRLCENYVQKNIAYLIMEMYV